ncbi:MAG: hypothetical protein J0L93_06270 [Deltaproteobacteria bacterium]|nr:hypothetical protein [Deltaproteobacteria bacterium]
MKNRRGHKLYLFLALNVLFIALGGFQVRAATIILSDLDGTLVKTEGHSPFGTYYKLYRIDQRVSVLQKPIEGPEVLHISTGDFERYKNHLAKGQGHPGQLISARLKDAIDPATKKEISNFIPGDYEIRDPATFEFFKEGRENFLLQTLERAYKADPSGKSWKGPFWDQMVKALSTAETAQGFGVLTARGHSKEEWKEFFDFLIKKKFIKFHPNYDLIFSVGRPEFDKYNTEGNVSEKKRAILELISQRLRTVPVLESPRLNSDGDRQVLSHFLIFAEDNQEFLESAFREMDKHARNRQRASEIKFAIFNAGTDEEVQRTGRPRFSVINNSGLARRVTAEEFLGEFLPVSKTSVCKNTATKLGGEK